MFFIGLYLIFIGDLKSYEIQVTTEKIEGIDSSFIEQPLSISMIDNSIWLFDKGYKLWRIGLNGSVHLCSVKGPGPGEFSPFFRSLIAEKKQISVLHQTGFKLEKFDSNGSLIESKKFPECYFYLDDVGNNVILKLEKTSDLTSFSTINLYLKLKNSIYVIPLYDESNEDRVNFLNIKVLKGDEFLFFYTVTSIKKQTYYLLIDLKKGAVLDLGIKKLTDNRSGMALIAANEDSMKRMTIPVINGGTFSSDLGFVLTEQTIPSDYTILSIYDPKTRVWSAIKVYDNGVGRYYQHVKNNLWGCFDGEAWAFVTFNEIH